MRKIDADALLKALDCDPFCCGDCKHDHDCGKHLIYTRNDICLTVQESPTVGGWISVNEQRPESGKHVLLCCEIRGLYSYKSRYQCIGFYAAKHSIPEGKYPEDAEFYDYDEEEDEYYLQEGWYEVIHNWDEYSSVVIADFVTHWKPQDELPKEEE